MAGRSVVEHGPAFVQQGDRCQRGPTVWTGRGVAGLEARVGVFGSRHDGCPADAGQRDLDAAEPIGFVSFGEMADTEVEEPRPDGPWTNGPKSGSGPALALRAVTARSKAIGSLLAST